MTDAEKIAMYEKALFDIKYVKGLLDGTWDEYLSACTGIATDALALQYTGYKRDESYGPY